MRRSLGLVILLLVLTLGLQSFNNVSADTDEDEEPRFVPGELIISFLPGVTDEEIDDFYEEHDLFEEDDLDFDDEDDDEEEKLAATSAAITSELIELLERDHRVDYAEPNFVLFADDHPSNPNDPFLHELWGLHNFSQTGGTTDADIDALEAWDVTTGSSDVIVAVIDTGVDIDHADLAANMWTNPGEVGADANGNDKRTNGIDDDANGYVDDVNGWDFFNGDNTVFDSSTYDDHGTHVAGTIGAVGNNGIGVTGVNRQAQVMPLKFLGPFGGSTSDAILAIQYATDKGAKAINASWGGGGFSQSLKDAIEGCNCIFAAAAGNDGSNTDLLPHYPSSYNSANLIAVAATDHNDQKASWSNYGATSVDLGAPGVNILSTLPNDVYGWGSGTSMATPHVTGVAALVYGQCTGLTAVQVKDRIMSAVEPNPTLSGNTVTGGRLNAANALCAGPGISVSPTSGLVTTEAGGGTDTFTVVLYTQPAADVTVGISSSDTSQVADVPRVSRLPVFEHRRQVPNHAPERQLVFVPVELEGNRQGSREEVDTITRLISGIAAFHRSESSVFPDDPWGLAAGSLRMGVRQRCDGPSWKGIRYAKPVGRKIKASRVWGNTWTATACQ